MPPIPAALSLPAPAAQPAPQILRRGRDPRMQAAPGVPLPHPLTGRAIPAGRRMPGARTERRRCARGLAELRPWFKLKTAGRRVVSRQEARRIVPERVGPTEYVVSPTRDNGMRVPVRIFADEQLAGKMASDRTVWQATNVASMPGVVGHVVVLPDGHEGYGFPVGGVAAMDAKDGMISPGGVGYDINCGVRLLRTNLSESEARPRIKELVADLFSSIPSGVGSKGAVSLSGSQLDEVMTRGVQWAVDNGYGRKADADSCEEGGRMGGADPSKVSEKARKRGMPQLGSLGSGNHFLEVQRVDRVHDEEAAASMGHQGGAGHGACALRLARIRAPGMQRLSARVREGHGKVRRQAPRTGSLRACRTRRRRGSRTRAR